MKEKVLEVSIFPIPNMVTFPGATVPLHVFEPRYRTMIEDSVKEERMVAVCHTKKEISPAKRNRSIKEVLTNNQATYSPRDIFCAGYCTISEKTIDGRIYMSIKMEHRVRLTKEIQTLPYRIATCSILEDQLIEHPKLKSHQSDIVSLILDLIDERAPSELSKFDKEHWSSMDPHEFSFSVFQVLRFDAELMQTILEMTNPEHRLRLISETLSNR